MKRRIVIKRRARHLQASRACDRAMRIANNDPAYSATIGKRSIWEHPEVARCMANLDRALDLLPPFTAEGKRFKTR